MKISLLTGSVDPHYQADLVEGLINQDVLVDVIAGDSMAHYGIMHHKNVRFLNFRGDQDRKANIFLKIIRVIRYYVLLIRYTATTNNRIFHIQWLNKFVLFDRTIMNLFYKVCGKLLVHTAHNVDEELREGKRHIYNYWSLKTMYNLMDHIIVHTPKMKEQMGMEFGIMQSKIDIIPHGVNNAIPKTRINRVEARKILNLKSEYKTLLFFGNISPYKGLDILISAFKGLLRNDPSYRLIIAGKIKKGKNEYWESIERYIEKERLKHALELKIEFIPDDEIEILFKAADILVLPYREIFQSGILFVAYGFSLPVIASDVGSLREDVVEGVSGQIYSPNTPNALTESISEFFCGELYKNFSNTQRCIAELATERYSWHDIGYKTKKVYEKLLDKELSHK